MAAALPNYDNVSRLSQLVHNPAGTSYDLTIDLSYNPASQIASTTRSNDAYAWGGHYAIDRNYAANGLNQYTAAGGASFSYDSRGNLTSAGTNTYSHDSESRAGTGTPPLPTRAHPARRQKGREGRDTPPLRPRRRAGPARGELRYVEPV